MLVVAPMPALGLILGRLFQVKFQSVQTTNGVKPIPCFAEREAELLVVRDRMVEVVDEVVAAVKAQLAPTYGSWATFDTTLPLNIAGATRTMPS